MRTVRLIKPFITGLSYRVSATRLETIDVKILTLLENSSFEDLVVHLYPKNAEYTLICLYELYAHGDTLKLLQVWRDNDIQRKLFSSKGDMVFHPLSLKGLMLRELVVYLDMET